MDQSKQALRDICDNANLTCASSLKEITLIETVTSFLEENGAAEIDRKVLRTLAEALSKSVDDTSPGVLQDVTMENSYASFDAGRLQGDSHSPLAMPGRSMRNVEEQMSTLRKENFNLKLRLYFMEESQLGHNRTNHSGESLSKQLIDAKIEAEVLRKTVEEKTELLKDAARAISLHEEMQMKAETESQALIDELQQHLRHYEEMEAAQEGDTRAVLDEKLKHLDSEVLRLRQELVEAGMRQIACQDQLKSAQAEHQETLSSCEAKIQELAIKNAELLEQFEKGMQCSDEANVSKVNNNKMEWERKQLKGTLDEYAANISRQEVDLCLLRRQNPFASLNAKRRQQAALFPLDNAYCRNPGPGPGLQRTASNSSLNSNFSAISVLGSSKQSSASSVSIIGGNGYAMPVDAEKGQRYQRMLHNDCARELFRLPIPAPGNHLQTSYSLPSLAGLRQFFAKMWGNMNLM